MNQRFIVLICCLLTLTFSNAQQDKNDDHFLRLVNILSIPNNANNISEIDSNINWLKKEFNSIGFETKTLKSKNNDLFFASKFFSNNLPTVLFYMHFDGQPVDNSKWFQKNPYEPVLKYKKDEHEYESLKWEHIKFKNFNIEDIRIYARSASDDKGPIAMFLSALHDINKQGLIPEFNIKVILDSEEEKGSPYLSVAVKEYRDVLNADYFVVFDGPMHDSGNPTLLFGVRGITTLTMEVYGMYKPQHSGHYGNYGPNPVFRASEIISSLKDGNGKVLVEGYYDGITFNEKTLSIMKHVPDDLEVLRHRAGFLYPEKAGNSYQEAIQFPSLNIRGIQSGWVGEESRTIVPDKVIVELDIRTVPESEPDELVRKLKQHISNLGYTFLNKRATKEDLLNINKPVFLTYRNEMFPFRTDFESIIGNWLRNSIKTTNKDIVHIRISGGSVPLS
ncbi:MAG: acetylornithine deacetylase, partial [Flavobacteriaceae bacterium CG17_big_fil_post_rev_8_21_14_2_50_33_15]